MIFNTPSSVPERKCNTQETVLTAHAYGCAQEIQQLAVSIQQLAVSPVFGSGLATILPFRFWAVRGQSPGQESCSCEYWYHTDRQECSRRGAGRRVPYLQLFPPEIISQTIPYVSNNYSLHQIFHLTWNLFVTSFGAWSSPHVLTACKFLLAAAGLPNSGHCGCSLPFTVRMWQADGWHL